MKSKEYCWVNGEKFNISESEFQLHANENLTFIIDRDGCWVATLESLDGMVRVKGAVITDIDDVEGLKAVFSRARSAMDKIVETKPQGR